MKAVIAVLPGDGIGPEVTAATVRVLRATASVFGHEFEFCEGLVGGAAIDECGAALPSGTLQICQAADAALLGAVGGPKWSSPSAQVRPEEGLLALRRELGLYANLRPVRPHPRLAGVSPLRPELLRDVDVLFVRELTGGIYFGDKWRDGDSASDVCSYTVAEVERIVRTAGALTRAREGRLTLVDKANVLETSRLWRETTERLVREEFSDLEFECLLVDAAAMHLLSRPAAFDVIVTENLFGDILTDEASMLAGSLGLLPSASLGDGTFGLYEPVHGSAPELAGAGVANPCGAILSGAMLLRHSLALEAEAQAVERAVTETINAGVVTPDIHVSGARQAGTREFAESVVSRLSRDPLQQTGT